MFLLELDPKRRRFKMIPFQAGELAMAQQYYLVREKETENTETQVVLVSVDSIDALSKAYPNYYVDAGVFLNAVRKATE